MRHQRNACIAAVLWGILCGHAGAAPAVEGAWPKLLLVGRRLGRVAKLWRKAGADVETARFEALAADPADLAGRCRVVVVDLTTAGDSLARTAVLEPFVRGGGGLWVTGDAPRWESVSGSPLEVLSPAVALDDRRAAMPTVRAAPDGPLADLPLQGLSRPRSLRSVDPPDSMRLGLLNLLSPRVISKPPWHDRWGVWAVGPEPRRLAVLSVARCAAGRTAAWGGDLTDRELADWSGFPEMARRVTAWLAGGGPSRPVRPDAVALRGYRPPAWWAKPLADGLRRMGSKGEPFEPFLLPPETLAEAGYRAAAEGEPAELAVLFGDAAYAAAPAGANVVLRAPRLPEPLPPADEVAFDSDKLRVLAKVRDVRVSVAGGKAADQRLPHRAEPADRLPTVGRAVAPPEIKLPRRWRIAFTKDTDATIGLDGGWHEAGFDDGAWQTAELGRRTTKLLGRTVGHDGAIWYRGWIDVPAEAVRPDAGLRIRCEADHLRVYVDGEEVAVEPERATLPLVSLGAGRHLLAVRTYGEFRRNYGLTDVACEAAEMLYRPDPKRQGFAERWYAPDADESAWTPVGFDVSQSPAFHDAMEGWARMVIDVPADAPDYAVLLGWRTNTESHLYVNGRRVGVRGYERRSEYVLGPADLKPGRNVVVSWVRFMGRQRKQLLVGVVPASRVVYRATVESPADGASLLARLHYAGAGWGERPLAASLWVDGRPAGGWTGGEGPRPELLAARALSKGTHAVEVRMTRGAGEAGLTALEVVDSPGGGPLAVTGWERAPAGEAGDDWFGPGGDRLPWQPAEAGLSQTWRGTMAPIDGVLRLNDPDSVYRTRLRMTAADLERNWTLFVRGSAVVRLLVNGRGVEPVGAPREDDLCYYPLNEALRAGENVLAFQPDPSRWRGLNLLAPGGREGRVFPPLLRSDVAPLVPADDDLAIYRLNRVLPVAPLDAPEGADVLFRWPSGAPAVAEIRRDGRVEVLAAPGVLDEVLPAPNFASRSLQGGGTPTIEYDYSSRINRDFFRGERIEQWLSALLARAQRRPAMLASLAVGAEAATVGVRAREAGAYELAWRLLDFQGEYLASGTARLELAAGAAGEVAVPLPDLTDANLPVGSWFSDHLRLRAALLSGDRREVLSFAERIVRARPAVRAAVRLPAKIAELDAGNAAVSKRVLHRTIDQVRERYVFTPGEAVEAAVWLRNETPRPRAVTATVRAVPALAGEAVARTFELTVPAFAVRRLALTVPADRTAVEQPWRVMVESSAAGEPSRDARTFVVARPRGAIRDLDAALHQHRRAGGYMWFMSRHTHSVEHHLGTDARPNPDGRQWWNRVRYAGDGNWLVAQGVHREDQGPLQWGPFDPQLRGEVMDSYGWFPNGMGVRQWWAPLGVREIWARHGRRSVVFAMSDWWQYDAAYPPKHYATIGMFNRWLAAHAGQTVAGERVDGEPIRAATLAEAGREIDRRHPSAWRYFLAEGMSRCAKFTDVKLNRAAPGTVQRGQGTFAHRLPAAIGGARLGPRWASAEPLGTLDADNHPIAGIWQYALEGVTFRALAMVNGLITGWERPQRYHYVNEAAVQMLPLGSGAWRKRLLDSRWQAIANRRGRFERVLNLTHSEYVGDHLNAMMKAERHSIGGGVLPHHWWINDRLAALAMTVAPDAPREPLLVVGESELGWGHYYGMLGAFRDAGLTVGGGVSIAELAGLPAERVPAMVWAPAERVEGTLLQAVVDKLRAGVPLLLIGHVPEPVGGGPDLRAMLGVRREADAPGGDMRQRVAEAIRDWPEALGVGHVPPRARLDGLHYLADDDAAIEPLVTRQGRLAVARSTRPELPVVLHGPVHSQHQQDDPALRRIAVRALREAAVPAVRWPAGTTGYAFDDAAGRRCVVVQNVTARALDAELLVDVPGGGAALAADLLSGRRIPTSRRGRAVAVRLHLPPSAATVLTLVPAPPADR